jgi:UDP-N-acetylglucosamine acyltransferase
MTIHTTAMIDSTAQVDPSATIGPYVVIGPYCMVGAGCILKPHAVLEAYVTLGEGCQVSSGAVLGGPPQDLGFDGQPSYVVVGNNVQIRECVTINRATGEGNTTTVGNDCMLMAYSHLGHNVQLGHGVILANNVQLGGYVSVGDNAFLGGTTVAHQFVKIGRLAIMGGFCGTRQDIPPFAMAFGRPEATVQGINTIGLKRRGFKLDERTRLKAAYKTLWFSGLSLQDAVAQVLVDAPDDQHVAELITFIQASKRGIRRPDIHTQGTDDASLDTALAGA